jgi:alcohol dehydrogenase (cytochrome c)
MKLSKWFAAPQNRVLVAALLAGASIRVDAQSGAGSDWTTPGGDLQGTRFSTLTQISDKNVGGLVEEFNFSTGANAYLEGQPLVVGALKTLYMVGGFPPNRLYAIALDSTPPGQQRWVFNPSVSTFAKAQACCGPVNRGAAYSSATNNLIYATLDNRVIAVNANTGTQSWQRSLASPRTGQTMTGAPLVVNVGGSDIAIVGNSGGETGVRGQVWALNATTGTVLWHFYNTGPDADVGIDSTFRPFYAKDQGSDRGANSWPGAFAYQHGGATVWNWFTYDSVSKLLFYGTSNPGPWDNEMRPGDNKWSSTIFARDPATGKAVWAYQVTPHDEWDFDSISESTVGTISSFNSGKPFLAHFDKNGFGYTLDAATGKVLAANPFVPVDWASGVDLTTGVPSVNPNKHTQEGVVNSYCPGPLGGKNFHPAAFSPLTGLVYVPAMNTCAAYEALKVNYIQGTPYMGALLTGALPPTTDKYSPGGGRLVAWDPATGTEKWGIKENFLYISGALATAGNLVFYGTLDGSVKAANATTGQVLFTKTYTTSVSGAPMTFLGPDGKQRVAIYTGLPASHIAADDPYASALPPHVPTGSTGATPGPGTVHVFKLP